MGRDESRDREARAFPRQQAFVLQFSADTDPARDRFHGRIEHVASGDRAAFASAEDAWAFVRRVLSGVGLAFALMAAATAESGSRGHATSTRLEVGTSPTTAQPHSKLNSNQ